MIICIIVTRGLDYRSSSLLHPLRSYTGIVEVFTDLKVLEAFAKQKEVTGRKEQ